MKKPDFTGKFREIISRTPGVIIILILIREMYALAETVKKT
jgi:hypothetical protein